MPDKLSFVSHYSAAEDQPVPFDIGSVDDDKGTQNVRTFRMWPQRVPGALLLDLDNMTVVGYGSDPFWDVMKVALGEDYDLFRAFVLDPSTRVSAQHLADLIRALRERALGFPTAPPSS